MPILQTVQKGLMIGPWKGKEQSCLESSEVASSLDGLNPGPVAHRPLRAHTVVTSSSCSCLSSELLQLSTKKGTGYLSSSWPESLAQACPLTAARVGPDFLLQDPIY